MTLITLLLPLALSAPLALGAEAGPAQAPRPILNQALTLQDAVAIALKESPVVRGAEEEVNMALAQVRMARAGTRPTLSATTTLAGGGMGGLYTTPAPVMPQSIQSAPGGSLYGQNLSLMFPLYTGGRLQALVRQSQAARKASDADFETMRQDVVLETKLAYRQVLLAQAVAGIYKSLSETTQERLRIDQAALDVGRIPKFYVLRDEAGAADAQQMGVNAQRDVDIALVMLKTTMGVDLASQLTLSDKLAYERLPRSHDELLALAEKQRPELAAARERVEGAQQGTAAARSAYRPQVSAAVMADASRARGMSTTTGVGAGVVIGLPVLDGGMRQAQVDEAQAGERRAAQQYERAALQVTRDVETAWLSLQAAERNIRTAEKALASADENYRVAQLRYTEGRGINVEVLDALTAFTRAQTNHVQALYDYDVARDQLARAVGEQ